MPHTPNTRYTVEIATRNHGNGDVPALLDMLRYEGGRVVTWGVSMTGNTVTIQVPSHRYTPERWASFGIRPYNVEVI